MKFENPVTLCTICEQVQFGLSSAAKEMAPVKRKNDATSAPILPQKRQKQSIPRVAALKEEHDFPRGGASLLTPLEHKQIQIQAKQDVLFEQDTGKKAQRQDFEDDENAEEDLPKVQAGNQPSKSRHKSKVKQKKGVENGIVAEKSVRVEGLSYKRLVPGSIVLGQISQINRHDIALSLPNNLTGFIPITYISDTISKKLEALVEESDQSEDEAMVDSKEIDLGALFSVGQYLRANVVSTQEDTAISTKGKKHITLSVNPRQANAGLDGSSLVVNSMIQAAVLSVEDHGLVMDLGLGDAGVRGFMSSKELGQDQDLSKVEEGSIFLCLVTGQSSNGSIVKLSADHQKIANVKKGAYLSDAPTVDCFLPGTAVDILIAEVTSTGVIGKVMGLLDVTADLIHSGAAASGKELEKKYAPGSKIRGRIICTFPTAPEKKLGVSLQDHILYLREKSTSDPSSDESVKPTHMLPISKVIPEVTVVKVEQGVGLLVDVGIKGIRGFVHVSRISDGRIESLSETTGAYKLGSVHKARVVGYNPMDGLFIMSLEAKVITQPFLYLEGVMVGQIVKGTIEKLMISAEGVNGLIVNISENISGLVPEVHFADVHLQYPEKKFKEGQKVTARVLSTHPEKRQLRLTLKKTLVNTDAEAWTTYQRLKPGMQAPGTLMNILPGGAVVQFYGRVRGFLPVSEMSESYIQDPKEHFRIGQVVNVHIVSVDADAGRMIVSCKDPSSFGPEQAEALRKLVFGSIVSGSVLEKTNNEIIVELEPTKLKATLPFEHLADGSAPKALSAAKKIRVGQALKGLVVLSKDETKRLIRLTSKPSLVKAANDGKLLKSFDDVVQGKEIHGYINNITSTGVFVQFAGDLTALLLKHHLPEDALLHPEFGMRRNQSITAQILSIDHAKHRFLLTMKPIIEVESEKKLRPDDAYDTSLSNPIDGISTSIEDFTLGKLTKAKIVSVKETQLNVSLADGVQGRIDVSEVFDTWDEVNDRKHPLKKFHPKQVLPVRIMGMHDSRNHRFLPITHRSKAPVFELTAKPSNLSTESLDILSIDKVKVDSSWLVFVNNCAEDCLWVNLSPNVRGRIRAIDVSDDLSLLKDLSKNFPVGSVLRAKVLKVDVENDRLDLKARKGDSSSTLSLKDISRDMVLPGKVTRINERQIMIQLSEEISGPVHLVDMADDYSQADPSIYSKNQIIRVSVKDVDIPNKRITLSLRPSRVLSSSLPVKDPDIASTGQLKVDDIFRGFIKNVADNGIFVSLASNVTAFVRISDLSDSYIKDWKSDFEVDQLVRGKIIAVDPLLNHVQMSLKQSHLDSEYKAPLTFSDMRAGQVVTGKVRKVEDYGVFIVVDNSANVSGLCHRTKISDQSAASPKKLYEEGDAVQAKVLNVNTEKKQISFGLKASYVTASKTEKQQDDPETENINADDSEDDDDLEGAGNGVDFSSAKDLEEELIDPRSDIDTAAVKNIESDDDMSEEDDDGIEIPTSKANGMKSMSATSGLNAGGFDWTGGMAAFDKEDAQSETDAESVQPKKKKRRRAEIQVDRTGELDANGPQSIADFERLLLGEPNSSVLWLSYMAFQLEISEVDKARQLAERALKTINIREESEKLNVWVALLNLENTYGSDETLEAIFKRACQYNDSQEIHERLISIHIQSGNNTKADDLFQAVLKKHTQDPALYINYATFLMTTLNAPDRARALLPRAMQALPTHAHLALTSKFAQLEFNSPNGDAERGRTVFETLLSQWPKRLDLWNVLLDLEIKQRDQERVRQLFERITGSASGLKPRKAKFFFKRWLEFEEKSGDGKSAERVKGLAAEYVRAQGQGKAGDG